MHTQMCIHTPAHKHNCIYTHMYTHTYTHTHTHTHTYTHTQTNTHTLREQSLMIDFSICSFCGFWSLILLSADLYVIFLFKNFSSTFFSGHAWSRGGHVPPSPHLIRHWFLSRERLVSVPISFNPLLRWEMGQGHYLLDTPHDRMKVCSLTERNCMPSLHAIS